MCSESMTFLGKKEDLLDLRKEGMVKFSASGVTQVCWQCSRGTRLSINKTSPASLEQDFRAKKMPHTH